MDRILPYIFATLTQHDRQKVVASVDFKWSKECWTHNFFRALELVFWRKAGIRSEVSVAKKLDGTVIYQFHTLESAIAHTEGAIRSLKKFKFPYRVWVPVLQTPIGLPIPVSPYFFAIAYVTGGRTTGGGGLNAPQSISVTTSGSNTFMSFGSMTLNDTTTAPTYNSVSSTTASTATTYIGSGRFGIRLYYLINPTTGANNATFTATGNPGIEGFAMQYSGCLQSSQPGGTAVNTGAAVSSLSVTVTVAAANSWIAAFEVDSGGPSGYTAGTNTNAVRLSDTGLAGCSYDGGPFATGNQSITVTMTLGVAPALSAVAAMEIKVAASTANSGFLAFFM